MRTQLTQLGTREIKLPAGIDRFNSSPGGSETILLVSDDNQLDQSLRLLANANGRLVVKSMGAAGTLAILHATRPVAIVVDLDLPGEAAWGTADLLLKEPGCPPVILLTGPTAQAKMRTPVHAGLLVTKSESPPRLLEVVQAAAKLSGVNRAKLNAIQRLLIQWLRPSERSESSTPAYRFWGINE